jgi:hypothetical protein
MATILAGRWPALKPLPVFKYETDGYRASVDFDKLRGEWVCRKTARPSNKIQELRGGLRQIIAALPGAGANFSEGSVTEAAIEQELPKDANRRREAMLEWREHYENGARFSELQSGLAENQRREFEEILRLTLTARQLQCNAKNIAYVFDALASAGGRFTTLIEISQRAKLGGQAEPPAANEAAARPLEMGAAVGGAAPVFPETLSMAPMAMGVVEPEEAPMTWAEPMAQAGAPVTEASAPARWHAEPPSAVEDFPQEELEEEDIRSREEPRSKERRENLAAWAALVQRGSMQPVASVAGGPQLPTRTLEISGLQVAALAILFAVISFTVGLAMARGLFGERLEDAQKTMLASARRSAGLANRGGGSSAGSELSSGNENPRNESASGKETAAGATGVDRRTVQSEPAPPAAVAQTMSSPGEPGDAGGAQPSGSMNPAVAPAGTADRATPATNSALTGKTAEPPAAGAESARVTSRDVIPTAKLPAAKAFSTDVAMDGAAKNLAPNRMGPSLTPYVTRPSAVLVTMPTRGNKPLRVIFPEKAIAASSTFAMTSQFSVMLPAEPGAATRKPARLQSGALLSFVWPRYARAGRRLANAETVKVRTTIGKFGQVEDIQLVSGSTALFPAVKNAMRQWQYRPTLLNQRAVASQQEVTIEFRPPADRGFGSKAARAYMAQGDAGSE